MALGPPAEVGATTFSACLRVTDACNFAPLSTWAVAFLRLRAIPIFQTKEVTTLPTIKKEATIAGLVDELGSIQGAVVTDYRGLTVEQVTTLRRRLRPVGGRYQVVKNTLLKRALAANQSPDLGDMLEGPTAVLFAEGDPVEATKILTAFVKELRKDLPLIKGGFLGNLVGTIQSPIANVVCTIGTVLQNLVGTIEAFEQKQSA